MINNIKTIVYHQTFCDDVLPQDIVVNKMIRDKITLVDKIIFFILFFLQI
jgi:hypothetical protein